MSLFSSKHAKKEAVKLANHTRDKRFSLPTIFVDTFLISVVLSLLGNQGGINEAVHSFRNSFINDLNIFSVLAILQNYPGRLKNYQITRITRKKGID